MRARRVKAALAAGAAAVAALTVFGAVALLGGSVAFFRSGADAAAAFNEMAPIAGSTAPTTWRPDAPDLPRALEDVTRTAVTTAYLAAWDHRTAGGDAHHLAGPAAAAVPDRPQRSVTEAHLRHDLHLRFYSADGQLVAFTDDVMLARRVGLRGGRQWTDTAQEHYTVVMILVDGSWRLRHWIRNS